ncbi:hypothetical protein BDZ89DRAFT_1053354 [Hymenopellis radicata]|nr:hypothetical protein BDZ89DRAFT_1053354 [Hymenopellis radicata]
MHRWLLIRLVVAEGILLCALIYSAGTPLSHSSLSYFPPSLMQLNMPIPLYTPPFTSREWRRNFNPPSIPLSGPENTHLGQYNCRVDCPAYRHNADAFQFQMVNRLLPDTSMQICAGPIPTYPAHYVRHDHPVNHDLFFLVPPVSRIPFEFSQPILALDPLAPDGPVYAVVYIADPDLRASELRRHRLFHKPTGKQLHVGYGLEDELNELEDIARRLRPITLSCTIEETMRFSPVPLALKSVSFTIHKARRARVQQPADSLRVAMQLRGEVDFVIPTVEGFLTLLVDASFYATYVGPTTTGKGGGAIPPAGGNYGPLIPAGPSHPSGGEGIGPNGGGGGGPNGGGGGGDPNGGGGGGGRGGGGGGDGGGPGGRNGWQNNDEDIEWQLNSKLPPSIIPTWDGGDTTAVDYLAAMQQLTWMSGKMRQGIANMAPHYWTARAQNWWAGLPLQDQLWLWSDWFRMITVIREFFLTKTWVAGRIQEWEEMRFRQAGHRAENPVDFIHRRTKHHSFLFVEEDGPAVVDRVLRTQPPEWETLLSVNSAQTLRQLINCKATRLIGRDDARDDQWSPLQKLSWWPWTIRKKQCRFGQLRCQSLTGLKKGNTKGRPSPNEIVTSITESDIIRDRLAYEAMCNDTKSKCVCACCGPSCKAQPPIAEEYVRDSTPETSPPRCAPSSSSNRNSH